MQSLRHGAPAHGSFRKLSIDFSRPLVASMGQHDPIDGHVTSRILEATAQAMGVDSGDIGREAEDFATMIDPARFATRDPLAIGGLLVDGCFLAQLGDDDLARALLVAAEAGLSAYLGSHELGGRPEGRLAFRELGLAIGLAAIDRLHERPGRLDTATKSRVSSIGMFLPLRHAIEGFWRVDDHRRNDTWREHEDINDVMLATSLAPEGFLTLDGDAAAARVAGEVRRSLASDREARR
jgi:hypothetical protein